MIISDLKEDVAKYENQYKSSSVRGFKDAEYQEYLVVHACQLFFFFFIYKFQDSVNEKCELSLKFLNSLQQSYNSSGENDFIRRKQQRELRCESFSCFNYSSQGYNFSFTKPVETDDQTSQEGYQVVDSFQ